MNIETLIFYEMLEWVLPDWTNGISKTKGAKQTMKIYMNQLENHQAIECSHLIYWPLILGF